MEWGMGGRKDEIEYGISQVMEGGKGRWGTYSFVGWILRSLEFDNEFIIKGFIDDLDLVVTH